MTSVRSTKKVRICNGKNKDRKDVVYKTVIRSIKRYYTILFESYMQDSRSITKLSSDEIKHILDHIVDKTFTCEIMP